jgi:hypothetical protein
MQMMQSQMMNASSVARRNIDLDTPSASAQPATPQPETALAGFLEANNITRWWPEIYQKLGITSISELQYIGGDVVRQYLAGMTKTKNKNTRKNKTYFSVYFT